MWPDRKAGHSKLWKVYSGDVKMEEVKGVLMVGRSGELMGGVVRDADGDNVGIPVGRSVPLMDEKKA